MSILADFVDKIISLKDPQFIEVAGDTFSNQAFKRIEPHVVRPTIYEVSGLDSIVQLIRKEIDQVGGFVFVRVSGAKDVWVSTTYQQDMSRNTLYHAKADVPGFGPGFREREEAIIELRSIIKTRWIGWMLNVLNWRIGCRGVYSWNCGPRTAGSGVRSASCRFPSTPCGS